MAEAMRTFVALELPERVKQALADYLAPLRELDRDVRWTKAANLHLTLKFIGDTAADQIAVIVRNLSEVCSRFEKFTVAISGCGVFPNEETPRVLWLGLHEATNKLVDLANAVDQCLQELDIPPERRGFSPHLTIARVKRGKAAGVIQRLKEKPSPALTVTFENCTFMQSQLHSAGAIYTRLHVMAFDGTRQPNTNI